ncbi:hypothetical protein IQ07DRAFT_585310 [Pyrenochaeta sp. DS3sAY3a]|nr:hypothetical protein IQ07DRAFT_585310 [Pyrenochaeta sp. DS3sAY3a]
MALGHEGIKYHPHSPGTVIPTHRTSVPKGFLLSRGHVESPPNPPLIQVRQEQHPHLGSKTQREAEKA